MNNYVFVNHSCLFGNHNPKLRKIEINVIKEDVERDNKKLSVEESRIDPYKNKKKIWGFFFVERGFFFYRGLGY